MDPNNNRLHLNFGFNEQQGYTPSNNRAYPTTPSTFPQPMYQQGTEYVDPQQNAFGQGYFMNNPYAPQQQRQPPQQQNQYHAQQYPQLNLQSPQPAYQSRAGYNGNDGANGLIQQFSNQDLSASARGRNPPPGQRPRTAGSPAPGQPTGHLAPPMPSRTPNPQGEEEELERNPEKYSENVQKRGRAAKELVNVFFQENIERARDRNLRYVRIPPRRGFFNFISTWFSC